ncbi:hypothetical protein DEO72_LG11g1337 [Vigna unguiculata]|uniref:Uncharacterized protein n=1 Tax=Vigna unguiculata TaxID=3917 RepID=A0A4D6NM07_VIGUN|nr:hypothetical protein DEO72_LG11g1337 [Vigna unguiculata]
METTITMPPAFHHHAHVVAATLALCRQRRNNSLPAHLHDQRVSTASSESEPTHNNHHCSYVSKCSKVVGSHESRTRHNTTKSASHQRSAAMHLLRLNHRTAILHASFFTALPTSVQTTKHASTYTCESALHLAKTTTVTKASSSPSQLQNAKPTITRYSGANTPPSPFQHLQP